MLTGTHDHHPARPPGGEVLGHLRRVGEVGRRDEEDVRSGHEVGPVGVVGVDGVLEIAADAQALLAGDGQQLAAPVVEVAVQQGRPAQGRPAGLQIDGDPAGASRVEVVASRTIDSDEVDAAVRPERIAQLGDRDAETGELGADGCSLRVVTERGDGTGRQTERGEGAGAVAAGLPRRVHDVRERHLGPDAFAKRVDVGVDAETAGHDDGRLHTHGTTVAGSRGTRAGCDGP